MFRFDRATRSSSTTITAMGPAKPKHIAAARELRDRWLEAVNAGQYLPQSRAKYQISGALNEASIAMLPQLADAA